MLNLKNIRLNIPHTPFKGAGVRSHCGPLITKTPPTAQKHLLVRSSSFAPRVCMRELGPRSSSLYEVSLYGRRCLNTASRVKNRDAKGAYKVIIRTL